MDTTNTLITIGYRISVERKRLDMSQDTIASLVECTQITQSRIETGKNSPSLNYLYELSQLGFDVQFIITGTRSKNLEEVTENLKQFNLQDSKQVAIAMLENVIALIREI